MIPHYINVGRRILFARFVTCDGCGQVIGWVYGRKRAERQGSRHLNRWVELERESAEAS